MPPLIGFYGDDLTGSTDTLAVLARAGLKSLLFLDPPDPAALAEAGPLDAVGIAGTARTMTPVEMDHALPPAFAALRAAGVRLLHYKVCSTFDSAPGIGSIGHALRLGARATGARFVPIVVGQPEIGRFVAFGTLFAAFGPAGEIFRLDRHPVMSRHPVTPMAEADLRRVLADQGVPDIALIDAPALETGALGEPNAGVVLFDTISPAHLAAIGALIGRQADHAPLSHTPVFAVGSSGLQQALLTGWPAAAALTAPPPPPMPAAAGPVLVLAGSRSPVTARQIETAAASGFAALSLDPAAMLAGDDPAPVREAAGHLAAGRSVVAHTSLGPDDPRGLRGAGRAELDALAAATGRFAAAVIACHRPARLGIAGGDTSGGAARAMGIAALAHDHRIAAGVPVCGVRGGALDGMRVMLKGGQMGPPDVLTRLRQGVAG